MVIFTQYKKGMQETDVKLHSKELLYINKTFIITFSSKSFISD